MKTYRVNFKDGYADRDYIIAATNIGEAYALAMANYWGTAGKKTRVGVRFGFFASNGYLSARCLSAGCTAGDTSDYCCGSAQVLLDVQ